MIFGLLLNLLNGNFTTSKIIFDSVNTQKNSFVKSVPDLIKSYNRKTFFMCLGKELLYGSITTTNFFYNSTRGDMEVSYSNNVITVSNIGVDWYTQGIIIWVYE